jgi:signal peptidase
LIGRNKKRRNNNGNNSSSNSGKNGQYEQKSKRSILVSKEIKYVIISIAAVVIIWLGLKLVLHVDNPFYVVSSESMVPTLMVGDIVVLRNGEPGGGFSFSDLQVGDIIVFHTEDGGGRTIVHRVVEISQDDKDTRDRLVKTKGDANPISYEVLDYPIREDHYYGKVILVIPKVGLVFKALSTPPISYIIILAAIAIVAIPMILLHYRKLV